MNTPRKLFIFTRTYEVLDNLAIGVVCVIVGAPFVILWLAASPLILAGAIVEFLEKRKPKAP